MVRFCVVLEEKKKEEPYFPIADIGISTPFTHKTQPPFKLTNKQPLYLSGKSSDKEVKMATESSGWTTPGITSCSPLVKLQAYGICCGIFESEEDREARVGAQLLNNYPITWYREVPKQVVDDDDVDDSQENTNKADNHAAEGGAGGFIDGLVTSVDKMFFGTKDKRKASYYGIPATLSIIDTEQCGPVILVKAIDIDKREPGSGSPPSISIPLYLVDTVSAGWSLVGDNTQGGVKLFARKDSSPLGRGAEELLRFDALGGGGDDWSETVFPKKSTEPNEHADRIIARLRALIDWNRNRLADDVREGKVNVV